jgi:hypothetical protein
VSILWRHWAGSAPRPCTSTSGLVQTKKQKSETKKVNLIQPNTRCCFHIFRKKGEPTRDQECLVRRADSYKPERIWAISYTWIGSFRQPRVRCVKNCPAPTCSSAFEALRQVCSPFAVARDYLFFFLSLKILFSFFSHRRIHCFLCQRL